MRLRHDPAAQRTPRPRAAGRVVAERRARRRGSRLIHLNTFSFQAPGFYEKHGYRRFGSMSGSPKGASRHFYVKRLSPPGPQ